MLSNPSQFQRQLLGREQVRQVCIRLIQPRHQVSGNKQLLALALQFQEMIDRGEVGDYAGLARLGCVSRERISQFMMLVWLAPDIQEAVLGLPPFSGRGPFSETALRRIAKIVFWEDQRGAWQILLGGLEPLK